jgi:hypothetical protein
MRTMRWTVAVTVCLMAPALGAQSVPRVALGKADAQLPDPFDNVSAVRELRDGRVIVADRMAKTVTLADFRSGHATAIGREGQGPGEFAFPTGLVALPGDTTLLVDPGQRRFLVIDPAGKPTALVSFPNGMMGLVRVKGADRQGRIYLQGGGINGGMGASLGGGQPVGNLPDSVTVLRWDRAGNHIDTLGRVKTPSTQMATSGSAGARSVVMRQQPFSPQDEWTVAPDGRVGVLRVSDYHAEWWTPAGQRVAGPPVSYAKAPVTQADKDRFTQASNNPRGRFNVTVGGPGRGAAPPPPPQLSEPDWPQYKPPFRDGTAQVAPDGSLWVQRYGADGAPLVYDVFDAKGNLARQVQFPKAARLAGFGAGSVYVATTTDDELETLGRYRMP